MTTATSAAKTNQFTPADWEFEGLDDNVVLYGSAIFEETTTKLQLYLDTSLINTDVEARLTFSYQSIPELIGALPSVAADLVANLFDQEPLHLALGYPQFEQESTVLHSMLEDVFGWNLDLYLSNWGVEWPAGEIEHNSCRWPQSVARLALVSPTGAWG